ncbi:hypothetical protein HYV86_07520 [Candidatus Woesearchaeota archaeon]|nr:hypothetical protein [Candidatus Woesearchaeota archaeon]
MKRKEVYAVTKLDRVLFLCLLLLTLLSISGLAVPIRDTVCELDGSLRCSAPNSVLVGSAGANQPPPFVLGYNNQAVSITNAAYLTFENHPFESQTGNLALWFKLDPIMEPSITAPVKLLKIFETGNNQNYLAVLYKSNGEMVVQSTRNDNLNVPANKLQWKYIVHKPLTVDEWHHFTFSWQRNQAGIPDDVKVFIDGEELRKSNFVFEDSSGLRATWQRGHIAKLPSLFPNTRVIIAKGSASSGNTLIDQLSFSPEYVTAVCPYCEVLDDVVLYQKPLFTDKGTYSTLLPSTKPQPSEIIESLSLTATPGEYEPTSFAIFTQNEPLRDVTAQISSLRSAAGNSIPIENIDLRVVKVWTRAGFGANSAAGFTLGQSKLQWDEFGINEKGILVADMLVYDDGQDLKALERYNPDGTYTAPRIATQLRTTISVGESKQFWLTIHVPQDTPAGHYQGVIALQSPSLATPLTIPLSIEVLPFTLVEPNQVRSIYYRNYLGLGALPSVGAPVFEKISEERYRAELSDIRAHGFNAVQLNSQPMSEEGLRRSLELARNVGFRIVDQTVAKGGRGMSIERQLELTQQAGFEKILYAFDEKNEYAQNTFANILVKLYDYHQAGAKVMSSLIWQTAVEYENPQSVMYDLEYQNAPLRNVRPEVVTTGPDYAVIALPNEAHEGRGFERYLDIINGRDAPRINAKEMYYWQIGMHKPFYARYNTGVLAYFLRNYIYGFKPYAYSHQGSPGFGYGSPYDTFDSAYMYDELTEKGDGYVASQMAVYPSAQGPIPTLEWEAVREGIDDLKYLTTLDNALTSLEQQDPRLASQLRAELNTALDPFRHLNSWRIMSGDDFDQLRTTIISLLRQIPEPILTAIVEVDNVNGVLTQNNNNIIDKITLVQQDSLQENQQINLDVCLTYPQLMQLASRLAQQDARGEDLAPIKRTILRTFNLVCS